MTHTTLGIEKVSGEIGWMACHPAHRVQLVPVPASERGQTVGSVRPDFNGKYVAGVRQAVICF